MPESASKVGHQPFPLPGRAVQVWNTLRPEQGQPRAVVALQEVAKSALYRLEGVGPGGCAVIAKRMEIEPFRVERTLYEEVLPRLPLTSLRCHGSLEEPDGRFGWLFLDDAGAEEFQPEEEGHRLAAAYWLAALHSTPVPAGVAARLPDRGLDHYRDHLTSARRIILDNLGNPALDREDRALLRALVSQLDNLDTRWQQWEWFYARLPFVVVHGDLCAKNARVRTRAAGLDFFPFDWEMAGWGILGVDLAPHTGGSVSPDLPIYWAQVRRFWPHLHLADIQRAAELGRLFRLLASVHWESLGLVGAWVMDSLIDLRFYHHEITRAVQEAGLEG